MQPRNVKWVIVFAIALPILGMLGCFAFCGISFFGRGNNHELAHSAEASFDGFKVRVELFHNHEFLAEYRKVVTVWCGETKIAERVYFDTGGHASMYLLKDGNTLFIAHAVSGDGFALDLESGAVSDLESGDMPRDYNYHSFGRFRFGGPDHCYRWMLKEELPADVLGKSDPGEELKPTCKATVDVMVRELRDPELRRKFHVGGVVQLEGVTVPLANTFSTPGRVLIALADRNDPEGKQSVVECRAVWSEREAFRRLPVGSRISLVGRVKEHVPNGILLSECRIMQIDIDTEQ